MLLANVSYLVAIQTTAGSVTFVLAAFSVPKVASSTTSLLQTDYNTSLVTASLISFRW